MISGEIAQESVKLHTFPLSVLAFRDVALQSLAARFEKEKVNKTQKISQGLDPRIFPGYMDESIRTTALQALRDEYKQQQQPASSSSTTTTLDQQQSTNKKQKTDSVLQSFKKYRMQY